MNRILSLLALLFICANGFTQKTDITKLSIEPFYIGDRIPDLPLLRIINYKDSVTTLSSFGDKLIILDFWSIHCRACIEKFPFIDSIQQANKARLQFILVTFDPREKVVPFLRRYDSLNHTRFSLPIVCGDGVLIYLFRHYAVPHYALIAPDGRLLAQSHTDFMNPATIDYITNSVLQSQAGMRKDHFPKAMYSFPSAPQNLLGAFKRNSVKEKP